MSNNSRKSKSSKPSQRRRRDSRTPSNRASKNERANQAPTQNLTRRTQTRQRQAGMAVIVRLPQLGMSDLLRHRITYLTGTVYVGNGTLGATNGVYMATPAGTPLVVSGLIPIAPADPQIGQAYVTAIEKLYRRKVYRSLKVHLKAVQSSTTNNAVVGIAPIRGPPGAAEIATTTTGTTAPTSLGALMSVQGFQTCDSFEDTTLDLTPYIAGGSGSAQNEFAIAAAANAPNVLGSTQDLLGVLPASFQIAGNSTVVGLQGTSTHYVIVEMVCDYLDFVGGIPVVDPESFAERRKKMLITELKNLSC